MLYNVYKVLGIYGEKILAEPSHCLHTCVSIMLKYIMCKGD